MQRLVLICGFTLLLSFPIPSFAQQHPPAVTAALDRAGKNAPELERAWKQTPAAHREGMRFLFQHMPRSDASTLTAKFLLENVRLAYEARDQSLWGKEIPDDIFLNNVLPYASINERRDEWRADFQKQFTPLIKDARSPSEAAAILNQKIFPLLKVRYSKKRNRADQGPRESIKTGTASCTGLSVLLIDACRSVGVPARFVGTPLWSDGSGNHSWVEVWDRDWHFTGAAEPTGDKLDRAWFGGRAATAQRQHPLHAIYAVSFKRTPIHFPLVWDRSIEYVRAVNVTDRYTRMKKPIPAGSIQTYFRVLGRPGGDRVAAKITVSDRENKVVFEGTANDERFDTNDHISAVLPAGAKYRVEFEFEGTRAEHKFSTGEKSSHAPLTLLLRDEQK